MCQVVINISNPLQKGKCEVCGAKTEAWGKQWLCRCPTHWQALTKQA